MTPAPDVGSLAGEAGQLLDALSARLIRFTSDEARAERRSDAADPTDPPAPDPEAPEAPAAEQIATEQIATEQIATEQIATEQIAIEQVPAQQHLSCVGWCPVCRSAELLKGDRSEVAEKLTDAALLLITTLRSLLPEPAEPAASGSEPRAGVERIDIR